MIKPQMPNIPGVGAVADTLDFVKNLWGSMSVPGISMPGMIAPSMSVEDLDKKIADLKAVEAWLNVNVTMLRGTIQAMEVQRGTIATLKSMGAALSNAVKQPGANEQSVRAAAPFVSAFFAQPAAEAPAPAPAPPPAPAPEAAKADSAEHAKPADAAAGLANPAAWWNMLQDQFKQAVSTAMSPDALASAGAKAFDAASKLGARAAAPVTKVAPAKAAVAAKPAAKAKPAAAKPAARKRVAARSKAV